jgi:hypothetical protein
VSERTLKRQDLVTAESIVAGESWVNAVARAVKDRIDYLAAPGCACDEFMPGETPEQHQREVHNDNIEGVPV